MEKMHNRLNRTEKKCPKINKDKQTTTQLTYTTQNICELLFSASYSLISLWSSKIQCGLEQHIELGARDLKWIVATL